MNTGVYVSVETWGRDPAGTPIDAGLLAEVYEHAADYIEVHGWTTGTFQNGAGEVCLTGAIGCALDPQVFECGEAGSILGPWRYAVTQLAPRLPVREIPTPFNKDGWGQVVRWNNRVAKDRFEVIDLLRHAAKELRDA